MRLGSHGILVALWFASFASQAGAADDPVKQLKDFVSRIVSSEPWVMGIVRILIGRDERGEAFRYVEFVHPFRALRPDPSARAQEPNWMPYEGVYVCGSCSATHLPNGNTESAARS